MTTHSLSRQPLEALAFQHSPDATLILQNRIVLSANLMAQHLFGYELDALIGQSIRQLYLARQDYEIIGDRAYGAMRSTGTYSDYRFMRHADGKALWLHGRGRALSLNHLAEASVWVYRLVDEAVVSPHNLTSAEVRVARYLIRGFTSKEIAISIGCSHRTVEAHRASMIRKFQVRNSGELIHHLMSGTYLTPLKPDADMDRPFGKNALERMASRSGALQK